MVAAEFVESKVLSPDWDWQGINERLQGIIGTIPEWGDADKQDLDYAKFVDKLLEIARQAYGEQEEKIGVEGMREGQWVLVDLNDVIVHIMMPQARSAMRFRRWGPSKNAALITNTIHVFLGT